MSFDFGTYKKKHTPHRPPPTVFLIMYIPPLRLQRTSLVLAGLLELRAAFDDPAVVSLRRLPLMLPLRRAGGGSTADCVRAVSSTLTEAKL